MTSLLLAWAVLFQAAGAAPAPAASAGRDAAPTEERPARGALPSSKEVRQALSERNKALQEERERLREEQRRLELLRQEIREDIQAQARMLGAAPDEDKISGSTPGANPAESREARVRRVSRGMASMTPATAALALSRLSVPFAAELLSVMDAKRVGKILDAMSPEQAARIMEALVARGGNGGAR